MTFLLLILGSLIFGLCSTQEFEYDRDPRRYYVDKFYRDFNRDERYMDSDMDEYHDTYDDRYRERGMDRSYDSEYQDSYNDFSQRNWKQDRYPDSTSYPRKPNNKTVPLLKLMSRSMSLLTLFLIYI